MTVATVGKTTMLAPETDRAWTSERAPAGDLKREGRPRGRPFLATVRNVAGRRYSPSAPIASDGQPSIDSLTSPSSSAFSGCLQT